MELELFDFHVEDIQWGDRTSLVGRQLSVNLAEIQAQIKDLTRDIQLTAELARPGESKRIVHVLDTMIPIRKVHDELRTFPGIDVPARLVGTGQTERLRNVLVTLAGSFPDPEAMTPIEKPREGIIDMAGVGARYSHGADYFHLVLTLEGGSALSNLAFDQALRNIGVRIARYLAGAEKNGAAPEQKKVHLAPVQHKLPKVVLIYQVQSQIPLVRTFYYGEEISKTLPSFVHPNEFIDGALVSGTYKSERKIPTSLHCAHPFIEELLKRHGSEIDFLGVILSRGYNDSFEQKKKMGLWSARLARTLGADGAVAMMEGTGNTTVDFMQTVKACEEEGIKTVAVLHEDDGARGYERPLVDHPREADAMISRGNRSEKLLLAPLDQVIGGTEIDLHFKLKHDPHKPLFFDPTIFFGAHCQMGASGFCAAFES
ncbi:MAG TPA: glycine/sarcosine/betaine reductase component B subunit [Terriglobales bacterium]|nr:glycine/sarcosine/betaine reductase component B subunit [Terriglobales bacterium]